MSTKNTQATRANATRANATRTTNGANATRGNATRTTNRTNRANATRTTNRTNRANATKQITYTVHLRKLTQNGLFLSEVPHLKNVDVAVLVAVKQNGMALQHASNKLKADKQVVLAALAQDGNALQFASPELRADKEVVLAAVVQNGMALKLASHELQADRDVVLAAVSNHWLALLFASSKLYEDKEVILVAVKQNGMALRFASSTLQADRNVVLAAVTNYSPALEFASLELQADKEIVLIAVAQDGDALQYAPVLNNDKQVVLAALAQDGNALQFASPELRADRKIVLAALAQDGNALQFASPELRADKEVVLAAISQNGLALKYASPELRANKEVVSAALSRIDYGQFNQIIYHLSDELQLQYLQYNGNIPKFLQILRNNIPPNRTLKNSSKSNTLSNEFDKQHRKYTYQLKDVVSNPINLKKLGNLKSNKNFILAAVRQNGMVLQYVPEINIRGTFWGFKDIGLRSDRDVVIAAITQDHRAYAFASEKLRNDDEIYRIACESFEKRKYVYGEEPSHPVGFASERIKNQHVHLSKERGLALSRDMEAQKPSHPPTSFGTVMGNVSASSQRP